MDRGENPRRSEGGRCQWAVARLCVFASPADAITARVPAQDEARAALEVWSNHVLSIVEGRPANVVPIRAKQN
jgi:hypothetical protein